MKCKYEVIFEVVYSPLFFFHPKYEVIAKNEEQAKIKAQEAFNSHPDNVDLKREIVEVNLLEDK
ncbi:hypothetical protein [Staphylococcus carnosus]|uniref:hypothetical protein n=1 Tax=Staphylococcus carnosus TaxID=1281 RepID=UPI00081A4913|nr:hypothetical protein [Staphylococcus carnosus]ANZ33887.1 hypothetical protein BEK99_08850 [Staphylococcus carnosus]UTB86068.1 hypothetical protein A2I66_10450 [Staphylococcus carnosus]